MRARRARRGGGEKNYKSEGLKEHERRKAPTRNRRRATRWDPTKEKRKLRVGNARRARKRARETLQAASPNREKRVATREGTRRDHERTYRARREEGRGCPRRDPTRTTTTTANAKGAERQARCDLQTFMPENLGWRRPKGTRDRHPGPTIPPARFQDARSELANQDPAGALPVRPTREATNPASTLPVRPTRREPRSRVRDGALPTLSAGAASNPENRGIGRPHCGPRKVRAREGRKL